VTDVLGLYDLVALASCIPMYPVGTHTHTHTHRASELFLAFSISPLAMPSCHVWRG
jgi:hypothetical protein